MPTTNLNRQIKKILNDYVILRRFGAYKGSIVHRLTALMEREIVKQAVKILEKRLNENEDRILKSYAARRAKGKK